MAVAAPARMFLLAAAAGSTCLALLELALAWRVRSNVPSLSSITASQPATWPKLSMVVPARDEAHGIEAALASKLACGYPNLEIIVVDDRSTDETGAIARRVAADDPRVVVVRIDRLPEGWLGKLHAMSVGADRATGDWILFSDADVHVEPGTLERTVAYAEHDAVDLVAVMPRMEPVGLALDASMAVMLRLIALAGVSWRANDDTSKVGLGVGAFNLVRRRALAASPGLSYLKMEIADDVALGALLKESGARCRFFAGREAVHLVCAERLGVLMRGMEKGGGLFGFSVAKTALVALVWLSLDFALPVAGALFGGWILALGLLQLALLTWTHVVLARHFRGPVTGALLWPVGSLLGALMLARSGALAWWRRAVVWRGTRYSKAEIEAGRRWINGRVRLGTPP